MLSLLQHTNIQLGPVPVEKKGLPRRPLRLVSTSPEYRPLQEHRCSRLRLLTNHPLRHASSKRTRLLCSLRTAALEMTLDAPPPLLWVICTGLVRKPAL